MALISIALGAAALLGLGWFSMSLVASLAEPVSIILAGVAGLSFFVRIIRSGFIEDYFSSEEGEFLGAGFAGATVFYLVFVTAQAAITVLSPLAGVLVVALGVAVFLLPNSVLFSALEVVSNDY